MPKKKEINYLLQIKCFYEWLERHELSPSAITLWHGLMFLWNQSFWKVSFTPAMPSIIARTGLSKSTVLRARKELQAAKLLQLTENAKNGLTRYKLVSFCEKSDTLYKQNYTIQNKTKNNPPDYSPKGDRKERRKIAREEKRQQELAEREALLLKEAQEAYLQNLEYCKKHGIC